MPSLNPRASRPRGCSPKRPTTIQELGEFILPYEAVRTAASPDDALAAFVQSTYERAATLGGWDWPALERAQSQPSG